MQLARIEKLLVSFFLLSVFLFSCEDDPRNSTHRNVSLQSIKKGKALAATYCGSCHQLPDPSMLNAASWERGVLPQMGPRLGIYTHQVTYYPTYRREPNIPKDYYPLQPAVTSEQWQNIIDYYTATSPDKLGEQKRQREIQPTLSLFTAQKATLSYANSGTSFIKIAPQPLPYAMVISDVLRKTTYFFDKALTPLDSIKTGPVVDMSFSPETIAVCDMGELHPNNAKSGKGESYSLIAGKWNKQATPLVDSLQRPVQLTSADLNGDGIQDYVVCEFGFLTGALSWMEGGKEGHYTRHVLRSLPGAIKVYVNDWNRDGKPDLCALMAQGDEGIFLYTNKGNGNFDEQRLLRFPPVYGSSYFELADFNGDGHPDIVYTCGDNADYSTVLKPYHGVYIFMNDGTNRFTQRYFFPINGCYKAMARDFDGDGDLDLAAISFFADYTHQPEEGFVYLKNEGDFRFQPYTVPEAMQGRWLTMDAGDVDGDGKIDLVLGNFILGPNLMSPTVNWSKAPPFLFLKNTGKK